MGWLQRYLEMFEGEPTWLIAVVSVALLAGVVVIVERVVKMSLWLLIVGLVAAVVLIAGVYFIL